MNAIILCILSANTARMKLFAVKKHNVALLYPDFLQVAGHRTAPFYEVQYFNFIVPMYAVFGIVVYKFLNADVVRAHRKGLENRIHI